jgi:hypothetical protein
MRAKLSLTILTAILMTGVLIGCTQARTDAAIAGDVQGKINADAGVTTKQVTVQSANGVVTLSGAVASDAERAAAANDAAQVNGVKTVVNNLTVGAQSAQAQTPADAAPAQPEVAARPVPAEKPTPRRVAREARHDDAPPLRHRSSPPPTPAYDDTTTASAAPAVSAPPASAMPSPTYTSNMTTTPSAPPAPVKLTIQEGTMLSVRLVDPIDTERNHEGEPFRATLDGPITVDDQIAIPADADVKGVIVAAKQEGHYTGQSALALELTSISYNGHTYNLQTGQYTRQGSSRSKNTAAKVGTGAAVGAVLGGIFGGGKGAAIGAASGAGVGGAAQTIDRPDPIRLPSETVINFRLQTPLTVAAANQLDRNSGRRRMDQ